jgi:hypothetical protein
MRKEQLKDAKARRNCGQEIGRSGDSAERRQPNNQRQECGGLPTRRYAGKEWL